MQTVLRTQVGNHSIWFGEEFMYSSARPVLGIVDCESFQSPDFAMFRGRIGGSEMIGNYDLSKHVHHLKNVATCFEDVTLCLLVLCQECKMECAKDCRRPWA